MDTRKGRYTTINDGSTSEEEVTYEHDDDDQHCFNRAARKVAGTAVWTSIR